jgi:peptidoglycan/xylan/chitin deacetylase (PgdA/CDA1 family)
MSRLFGAPTLPRLIGALVSAVLLAGMLPAAGGVAAAEPHEVRVPILIYHHVTCDSPSNVPNTQIWICPARFEAQLKYLKDRGWRTITTDQLADHMKNRTCPAPRTMVVTVDDSARFGYTNAAPILEKLGMRATYFVVVGMASQSNALSFNDMRDLLSRGHGIGNHSMTHLDLVGRGQNALDREVEQSQQRLRDELGFRPRTFAYPNGTHDANARARVAQSGFELAFTADPTFVVSSAKPLVAPRLFVSKRHAPEDVAAKIEPYAQPCTASGGPATAAPEASLATGAQMGTSKVGVKVDWSSGATADATAFQLQQRKNGGAWKQISLPSANATSLTLLRAPGNTFEYRVRAASGGSYGAWAAGSAIRLALRQENHTAVKLTGWQRVSVSSAMGGALSRTSSSAARATLAFSGSSIGWISPRGPGRGVVDVYVDGALAGTVDLYAASNSPRRLVFVHSWSSSGSHSIELRPRATSGRPRADVDAFVILNR